MKKFVSLIDNEDYYTQAFKIANKIFRFIDPYSNRGEVYKMPTRTFNKIVTIIPSSSVGNSDIYFVINKQRYLLNTKGELINKIEEALKEQNS